MKSIDVANHIDRSIRRKTFDERASVIGKVTNIREGKGDVTTTNGGVYRAVRMPDGVSVEENMWVNLERSGMGYYISGISPQGSG